MKNRKAKSTIRKRSLLLLSLFLLSWGLAGCGGSSVPETRMLITGDIPLSVQEGRRQMAERWERPIDFPFWESETYSVVLALSEESCGEYELRLYDADGRRLQQISCGKLVGPIQLSCDDLYYFGRKYLGIFSADSPTGLFYAWEDERFSENPIEVPRYAESRGTDVLTVTEDDTGCQTEELYQLNWKKNRMEPVRSRKLQKDTGFIEIWDYMENCCLFSGIARTDEAGEPVNREFYDMLLWENRHSLWDDPEAKSTVSVSVRDDDGRLVEKEYENREAFLAAYGFANGTPIYEYHDEYRNLQLELYRNEDTGEFCGIAYSYAFNSEWEKRATMYGFCCDSAVKGAWNGGWQDYSVAEEGYNGSEAVEDYEEIIAYTPDGKPDYFKSQGIAEWEEGYKQLTTILEINHVYRDDGTLFYREYHHNSRIFYTTFSNLNSFFDENGRPAFESGYITHGHLENYYIYEDEGDTPAYVVCLDYNPSALYAEIIRYE